MDFFIKKIGAREISDSRGNPTVEAKVDTNYGSFSASVPSGASKGEGEALELRDGGKRKKGLGVLQAIKNIEEKISPALKSKNPAKQREIDELMIGLDGTENKSKLGANAILPVSIAVCRAGARAQKIPLYRHIAGLTNNQEIKIPKPFMLFAEGGMHAENDLDFQEFMLTNKEEDFLENFNQLLGIYRQLEKNIRKRFGFFNVKIGDEGGFSLPFKSPEEVLEMILQAASELKLKEKIGIVIDAAASHFFSDGKYEIDSGPLDNAGLCRYYLDLTKKYPIFAIEDPFSEKEFNGWQDLNEKVLIIGDDLTVTNAEMLKKAYFNNLCRGVIIKPNQIGTVSEAIKSVKLAKSFSWKTVVSHRSGETTDDFIADFSVGTGADFIKTGAPSKKERMAKYDRLVKIEEELAILRINK